MLLHFLHLPHQAVNAAAYPFPVVGPGGRFTSRCGSKANKAKQSMQHFPWPACSPAAGSAAFLLLKNELLAQAAPALEALFTQKFRAHCSATLPAPNRSGRRSSAPAGHSREQPPRQACTAFLKTAPKQALALAQQALEALKSIAFGKNPASSNGTGTAGAGAGKGGRPWRCTGSCAPPCTVLTAPACALPRPGHARRRDGS